ncbi:DUF4312 family protein [Lacticaseibacillus parahuelsenbergensis]|uniref:DUF4312 family protein n=1 Tax=Lacticaseibacillus parahuelsenbergensis TaxID=3068305 RepID=A0ABY9L267_9LACO|nr:MULTISPECIES: DUF4312 family protein [Lacticaseibacillus]MDE3283721.1 DUF4312 family protein [Lacticaseibacillus casei]WLV77833.1 DUF4312 family protein [Lacticaseibacillus sp. NCIMB 15471]
MTVVNETKRQVVTVSGKGETKQQAFAAAFSSIQKQLVGNGDEAILRIIPEKVEPLKLVKSNYTEKFLFFFFKRTRTTYAVTLAVTVAVSAIDLDALAFEDVTTPSPDALSLPNLKNMLKGVK